MTEMHYPMPPEGKALMDFNPFGMEIRRDPSAFHQMMFDASPGFVMMDGVPSAFVATYEQSTQVLRDFKSFSSLKPKDLPGMQRIDFFNGLPVMNYSDPPDHTRRRKVVNPAFTPKRVERVLEDSSAYADQLIDKILDGRKSFDVMEDFARPLSLETMMRGFLGVPEADQHIFLSFFETLKTLDKLEVGDPKPQAYLDAWAAGTKYCCEQQDLARQGKCDNLIGLIANSADEGAIDDDEMMAMMIVLLTGGFSAVAGTLGLVLKNLAANPGLSVRLREDPVLVSNYLEESLRLDPPVSLVMRFAAKDTEVGGTLIPQGMPVYVMIAAACHDPGKFPDPYRFDVDRANAKDHIAFGFGMHTCIGSNITRMVVPMALNKFVERVPNLGMEGDGDVEWEMFTPRARHLKSLTLTV